MLIYKFIFVSEIDAAPCGSCGRMCVWRVARVLACVQACTRGHGSHMEPHEYRYNYTCNHKFR